MDWFRWCNRRGRRTYHSPHLERVAVRPPDAAMYAMALYLYSLEPAASPPPPVTPEDPFADFAPKLQRTAVATPEPKLVGSPPPRPAPAAATTQAQPKPVPATVAAQGKIIFRRSILRPRVAFGK